MKIEVVYRRFRRDCKYGHKLVISKEYKNLMKKLKFNERTIFIHSICWDGKEWRDGTWYDKINIET